MREIFTSGSSRGEWVAPFTGSPSLLLYRSFLIRRAMNRSRLGFEVPPRKSKCAYLALPRYKAGNPIMTTCHPSDDGEIENWLW